MTEKTAQQINRMKEQTIGVEVEMNNITRKAAAKLAAEFFGTNRSEYTGSRNGYETYSAWDAQGSRTAKSANWSHRSCTTQTSKPCRS